MMNTNDIFTAVNDDDFDKFVGSIGDNAVYDFAPPRQVPFDENINIVSAFQLASLYFRYEMLEYLLITGVNVNHKYNNGQPPLHTLIMCTNVDDGNERLKCIRLLLSHPQIDVNALDGQYRTPLICAVLCNDVAVVKMLLKCNKINVNIVQRDMQHTALSIAQTWSYAAIVRKLVQHPDIDINMKYWLDRTAIMYQTRIDGTGALMCARQLLDQSAIDLNHVDEHGDTAITLAVGAGTHFYPALFTHGRI
jgi:ankyrin repeat protein